MLSPRTTDEQKFWLMKEIRTRIITPELIRIRVIVYKTELKLNNKVLSKLNRNIIELNSTVYIRSLNFTVMLQNTIDTHAQ